MISIDNPDIDSLRVVSDAILVCFIRLLNSAVSLRSNQFDLSAELIRVGKKSRLYGSLWPR